VKAAGERKRKGTKRTHEAAAANGGGGPAILPVNAALSPSWHADSTRGLEKTAKSEVQYGVFHSKNCEFLTHLAAF
jgi:hypothetical protein